MGVPVTRINKIGEGSPHVVDLIRERRCDLVINTPTGSGARADGYEIRTAAVRHGIPCVTTMTGATAAVRAIAAESAGRRRGPLPPGDPRRRRRAAAGPMTAPFGRRLCEVTENRASGGYRRLLAARPRGPRAAAGPVLHARRRARTGRQRGERPFLPRALSVAETGPAAGGVRLDFLVEGVGPGHRPALRARAGGGGLGQRPARQRLLRAARGQRRAPPGRSWSAAASASPRWPCCAAASRERGVPARVLLGFRDRAHSRRPRRLFWRQPLPEVRLATEDGHAGHRGYVTDLLAAMLAGDDADSAPPSTPAARRRCWRRCGRSAPSAASPASWRWSRRWPAASAPASAAPCRKPDGGYLRLCVDGPVVARRAGRRGDPCLTSAGSSSRTR